MLRATGATKLAFHVEDLGWRYGRKALDEASMIVQLLPQLVSMYIG
jgi:hypothetical protein